MTASKHVNHHTITLLYNRNRTYQSLKAKYDINYSCVHVLEAMYLYGMTVKLIFDRNAIHKYMCNLYSFKLISRYFDRLLLAKLIILTQAGNHKLYSLTDLGYSAIQEISDNADRLMYDFCSKYSIEL